MLTVKGKTLIFLTAADLEDANKTHQTVQTGPAGQKAHKPAAVASKRPGASDVGPAAQLAAVVTLLNDADHKLSQARSLLAEAFALVASIEE